MDRQYFKSNISPKQTYRNTVAHTLEIIENVMTTTFGPYGGHNLFKNGVDIRASKDGLENLSMLKFDETIPSAVYTMAMEIAADQAMAVGDGTTSAVLVMAEVYKELIKNQNLWSRYTSSMITSAIREIQQGLENVLTSTAIQITKDPNNTTIKALLDSTLNGNTKLVDVISNMTDTVKDIKDKNIIIDYSNTNKTYFETIHGINISGKLMSPVFGTQAEDICILKNVEIIIIDGKVNILNDILTYTNKLKPLDKSLLIICSGVNENFYRYIEVISQTQPKALGNFCVAYTSANTIMDRDSFYDVLKSTDCTYMPENTEISTNSIADLHKGYANNVCIKNGQITLGGCIKGEMFDKYVEGLQTEIMDLYNVINNSGSNIDRTSATVQKNKMIARYAKLTTGVTTIYAGGDTQQDKHITFRAIEDGIKALQSALNYGYFNGCNTVVPNILIQMILEQKTLDATCGKPSIYVELEQSLLTAYINVYKKLIKNRAHVTDLEALKFMLSDEFSDIVCENNTTLIVTDSMVGKNVLEAHDLTGCDKLIINPAKTDINIIWKAISAAAVLATSNTIITDKIEFEGLPDC